MGMFGKGFPYYKVETEYIAVPMNHAVVLNDEPEPDVLVHESELSGGRASFVKGERWMFEVQVNIFKNEQEGSGDILYQFYKDKGKQNILIYRFADSVAPIMNEDELPAFFTLVEIKLGYLNSKSRKHDIAILTFTSNEFVDIKSGTGQRELEYRGSKELSTAYDSKTIRGISVYDNLVFVGGNTITGTIGIKGAHKSGTQATEYGTQVVGDCYTPAAQLVGDDPVGFARRLDGFAFLPIQFDQLRTRAVSDNVIQAADIDTENIPNYFRAYFHKIRNKLYVAGGHKLLNIFDITNDGTLGTKYEPTPLTNYHGQYIAPSPYGSIIAVSSALDPSTYKIVICSFDGSAIVALSEHSLSSSERPKSLAFDRWGHLCVAVGSNGFYIYDVNFITGELTKVGSSLATRDVQICRSKGDIIATYSNSSKTTVRLIKIHENGTVTAGPQIAGNYDLNYVECAPVANENMVMQMSTNGVKTVLEMFNFKL